ncbi:MAG: putative metal-binding motif-containing protein, partial [Myxococcota bacterium]
NCVRDADGCFIWSNPASCGGNDTCENGQCAGCIDNDGDGYGENCSAGTDCDDTDPTVHAAAPELCDGVDNDCDGQTDEGFAQLGDTCTVNQNGCTGSGTYVCNSSGSGVECDGTVSTSTEVCDGVDNDCDGQTDEDYGNLGDSCTNGSGVCAVSGQVVCDPNDEWSTTCDAGSPNSSLAVRETCDGLDNDCDGSVDENACYSCVEDSYEENDSSLSGTDLTYNRTLGAGTMCGESGADLDRDWFKMGTNAAGATVDITYPTGTNAVGDAYPDIRVDIFCGSSYCGNISGSNGYLSGTIPNCGTCNYAFYLYNSGANPPSGTPYEVTRR